ncbi:hypothetical protein [Candidatus Hydrogenosomobacter endosymbioticus]|uniref:Uncharacterized protein n=1 Tax=Candidatus Hydrogenosomobacter endosymbioticus TaxID=2558174 RepID=A0ABN6L384_9PROT|nr:hypothetical protein [Candidatus Hydrogenosomobacter endosymbioticus]BDB96174.1 hypothetical protein HYD_3070 [Candidatus Hydrogenosomobacter endosymbioticus]
MSITRASFSAQRKNNPVSLSKATAFSFILMIMYVSGVGSCFFAINLINKSIDSIFKTRPEIYSQTYNSKIPCVAMLPTECGRFRGEEDSGSREQAGEPVDDWELIDSVAPFYDGRNFSFALVGRSCGTVSPKNFVMDFALSSVVFFILYVFCMIIVRRNKSKNKISSNYFRKKKAAFLLLFSIFGTTCVAANFIDFFKIYFMENSIARPFMLYNFPDNYNDSRVIDKNFITRMFKSDDDYLSWCGMFVGGASLYNKEGVGFFSTPVDRYEVSKARKRDLFSLEIADYAIINRLLIKIVISFCMVTASIAICGIVYRALGGGRS